MGHTAVPNVWNVWLVRVLPDDLVIKYKEYKVLSWTSEQLRRTDFSKNLNKTKKFRWRILQLGRRVWCRNSWRSTIVWLSDHRAWLYCKKVILSLFARLIGLTFTPRQIVKHQQILQIPDNLVINVNWIFRNGISCISDTVNKSPNFKVRGDNWLIT